LVTTGRANFTRLSSFAKEKIDMSQKDFVAVKVLDLPGSGSACACGASTGGPVYAAAIHQKLAELKAALEESYPGKTKVDYIDLRENQAEKESEIGQLLVTRKYPPPLVVIAGEPKFAGSIQVKKIVKEVANILS
jgi:disulfide oxidoreductase YuzD